MQIGKKMKYGEKQKMYLYFKRFADVFVSIAGLIVLWPLLLVVAVIIKLESPGPALFKQKRLGRFGREFTIYKFRSMSVGAEHTGTGQYSYEGDPRVTKVGAVIRKLSIDELPQFINILKGDMSLIGFRPPLTYHPWSYIQYTDQQKKMFQLRPGVTGWAQVHGRKTVNWEERIKMNVWYVENVNFKTDIKILFLTIIRVLKHEDNVNMGTTV